MQRPTASPLFSQKVLVAGGVFLTLAFVGLAFLSPLLPPLLPFLAAFSAAFLIYGFMVWKALRSEHSSSSFTLIIVGFAIAFRLLMLVPEIALSDDIYRYLWEGKVANAGENPFLHSPDSDRLMFLRDANWEKVTHREIPSVYPPISQWSFRLVDRVFPTPRGYRSLIALVDLLTIGILAIGLRRIGKPTSLLLIYAWNPLVIVELCGSGHLDGLALPGFALGLLFFLQNRRWAMAACLAIATLAKLHAVFLFPLILRKNKPIGPIALYAFIVGLGYAPFIEEGFLQGLGSYARHWSFNSPIHDGVREAMLSLNTQLRDLATHSFPVLGSVAWVFDPGLATRLALGLLLLVGMVVALKPKWPNETRALILFTAFLAVTPTLHPWYLVWLVPLLTVRPYPPLILLSGTVVFTYATVSVFREGGPWVEHPWARWVEFGPVVLWAALDRARAWRRRQAKRS